MYTGAETLEEDIESLKKEIEKLYNTLVEEREYNRRETASKKEVNHMKKGYLIHNDNITPASKLYSCQFSM